MEIQLIDHIVYADYDELRVNNAVVNQIVCNTEETWQPDRPVEERGKNTRQGKIAEEIVETFIKTHFNAGLSMKTYDDIRNDNYEKHAPFDFLIWKSGEADIEPIEAAIRKDILSTEKKNVKLSKYTRELCKELHVKIAEVKSTKIRAGLKRDACFGGNYEDMESVKKLTDTIKRKDDVFCYPHYKRSEVDPDYSMSEYCQYVKSIEPSLAIYDGEELREKVIDIELEKQCSDIFIRVYIDPSAKKGFVIGWMQRERLLDYAVGFKRMHQEGKSERALYFAKNLRETEFLEKLPILFKAETSVYASPFTSTDFYHKRADCCYLSRVRLGDLIVFESEEEAVKHGRYKHRCRKCFG